MVTSQSVRQPIVISFIGILWSCSMFLSTLASQVYKCHDFCVCNSQNGMATANCEFRNIDQIPAIMRIDTNDEELGELLLTGNSIPRLNSNSFDDYRFLKSLQLSTNSISFIDDSAFKNLQSIETINLNFNNLKDLPVYSFIKARPSSSDARNLKISISHNPIPCSCEINAKLNTIKNMNEKIEQIFVTCDDNSNTIQVEKYAEKNCDDPSASVDNEYTRATTKVAPTHVKMDPPENRIEDSGFTTQVTSPPLKTSVHPNANGTVSYPTLNLESGEVTIKLWHLLVLVGSAMLASMLVILVCYLAVSRLCKLGKDDNQSTSPRRSLYLPNSNTQDLQFTTLNRFHTSQSNGYVPVGLYDNLPLNGTAYSTLSRGPYDSSEYILGNDLQRRSRNSSQISASGNLLYSTDNVMAPTCNNIEDFPDFTASCEVKPRLVPNGHIEAKFTANGKLPDFSDVSNANYIRPNRENELFFLDRNDPNCRTNSNYVNFGPREDDSSDWLHI